MKSNLTVVVSAYNEEQKIGACLESVQDIASEIIVVDNKSLDKTAQIAKKLGAKIYTRENNLMLNANKNFGFTKATKEWILCLDADERITPELAEEMSAIVMDEKNEHEGYKIPRKNIIFGKWIQSDMWWPDYQIRLFKRGKGKFAEKHVHELITITGSVGTFENAMIHASYSSITEYVQKLNTIYTENEVKNEIAKGVNVTWTDAIAYPTNDFLKTFFLQKGYRNGLHGLVLSLLQAFYMEIVFAKLWERQGFQPYQPVNFLQEVQTELGKTSKDFRFWIFSSLINESKHSGKKLFYKVLRKVARS